MKTRKYLLLLSMDKFIYDESNGLWYELQGDYYPPRLPAPEDDG